MSGGGRPYRPPHAHERLFGTDGMRAPFGSPPLVEATVVELGLRLAEQLAERQPRPRLVLGGDTRASTPTLAGWLGAGLAAGGAEVLPVGVLPTPAIAHLTRLLGAQAGVAISASHNPAADNGIKLIAANGQKWPLAEEARLESRLTGNAPVAGAPGFGFQGEAAQTARDRYRRHLLGCLDAPRPLCGLRVALDAANGAASDLAGEIFAAAGAEPTVLFASPDGANINAGCGSTAPLALQEHVAQGGFDLAFAFDGDADRALLVDERGVLRDGDEMLWLWARTLAESHRLTPPAIVATSMSNFGLERALVSSGVRVVRCDVGDRAVVETLLAHGLRLGGEQSGHLVDLALATTGDGLLTALALAAAVAAGGRPASEQLAGFHRFPQLLRNVPVQRKVPFADLPAVAAAARAVEARLHGEGRLVLRYSGTEPLARIMLEGPDAAAIEAYAAELAAAIERALG